MDAPSFVLLHGAWDGGWMWAPVRQRLTRAGAAVFTPSFTGSGERVHLGGPTVGLGTYLQDVENVLRYEELERVVLVGFSFSGIVATGVADRAPDRIAELVYVDAFVPRPGEAFADLIDPRTLERFHEEAEAAGGGWAIPPPRESDPRATPLPLAAVTDRLPVVATDVGVRRTYVRCVLSEDGPFDDAAARARREGWGYHELQSGHHPMQEIPDELTALLLSIAARV